MGSATRTTLNCGRERGRVALGRLGCLSDQNEREASAARRICFAIRKVFGAGAGRFSGKTGTGLFPKASLTVLRLGVGKILSLNLAEMIGGGRALSVVWQDTL